MSNKSVNKPGSNLFTIFLGGGLILLGALFLLGRFVGYLFAFDIGHYAWPFFIIVPGLLMFLTAFFLERQAGVTLAMFGGMTIATGAILLIQNIFDVYATWSYAWALVAPTSMGLAKVIYGALCGLGDEVKSGLNLAGVGLGIFVFAAFFFELMIGVSGFGFRGAWYCWPTLLIGLGVVVLLASLLTRRDKASV